jgi:membrane-bound lytic murein transglycosylase D
MAFLKLKFKLADKRYSFPKKYLLTLLCICLVVPVIANADANKQFPLPDELKPDVKFWTRIYTEVTTQEGLIHDNQYLNIVYEKMSFQPGTSYKARKKLIKKKKAFYKKILQDLAKGRTVHLTAAHKRVRNQWPANIRAKALSGADKRLRFQLGQANRFKEGLVRSGRWQPFIRDEFKKLEIPMELASLPHVESSFQPDAKSHAGAAGLWQFTGSTGRRFMRIDHVVDERLDPYMATRAAGLLLKNNHEITTTWPLALTAYNHGAAGMRRAVKEMGGTDITKIVREYKGRTFGFASRNFYNAFKAALEIDTHPERYFGKIQREQPLQVQEVKLSSYYTAQGLMKAFSVKNNIFKSLNPALQPTILSNAKLIPKGYFLRVPTSEHVAKAPQLLATVPEDEKSKKQKPDVQHRVRRGESLSGIAKHYKVSLDDLVQMNSLRSRHKIRIGQVLKLPNSAKRVVQLPKKVKKGSVFYTVKKGDRLSVIAKRARVSESDIIALNKLKNRNHLVVGQKLRLTQDHAVLALAANEDVYKKELGSITESGALLADPSDYRVAKDNSIEIQSNETLGHYAEWLGLKTKDLRQLNKLPEKRQLVVGKRIKLSFNKVSRSAFEKKRLMHHKKLQTAFFKRYRVNKTIKRRLKKGESVWDLAKGVYKSPIWLLRQYNPKMNMNKVAYGSVIVFPNVVKK